MLLAALDIETESFEPGNATPRMVSMQIMKYDSKPVIKHWSEAKRYFLKLVTEGFSFVGHHIAFDLSAICAQWPDLTPLVFELYETNRVRCTYVRESLLRIREGTFKFHYQTKRFNLGYLAKHYLGMALDKGDDSWRKFYGFLINVMPNNWPSEAISYALDDVRATMGVFFKQLKLFKRLSGESARKDFRVSPDELDQTKYAFGLQLTKAWGIRTDAKSVAALEKLCVRDRAEAINQLAKEGIFKKNPRAKDGWSRDMKTIYAKVKEAYEFQGQDCPVTPSGRPCTDKETLEESGDESLEKLSEATGNLLTTFIPALKLGTQVPICSDWNVLVETGRVSCRNINLTNLPRKGGARECFRPRKGNRFINADFNSAESCALAEICYEIVGYSKLGDAINKGLDPHLRLGAQMLGWTYAKAKRLYDKKPPNKKIAEARQGSKIANFGYPGGLGASAFISYAKGYGFKGKDTLTEEKALDLRNAWFDAWPEMREYFNYVGAQTDPISGSGDLVAFVSGRVRGRCSFTQYANGGFQQLIADGGKAAFWAVIVEMYIKKNSPLYGYRPNAFIHDEILAEGPKEGAAEACDRMSKIMVETMASKYIRKVKVAAEPRLMDRWYKGAKTVRDKHGKLLPWVPEAS